MSVFVVEESLVFHIHSSNVGLSHFILVRHTHTHTGGSEACTQNRARCYDCVTFDEWKDGIQTYYQNGGGVKFDFTVAPETRAIFEGK